MCGIFCLVQTGTVDLQMAKECLLKLTHRGPDGLNYKCIKINDKEVFLGFVRLAIMDISNAGLQPFYSSKDRTHVICNGEIYNFKEIEKDHSIEMISSCDCEIILPLYEKLTNKFVDHLDAEFAMVILDEKSKIIKAMRDRYGVRPLFYGYNTKTGTFGLASEMKALHPIMEFVSPFPPDRTMHLNLSKPLFPVNYSTHFTIYNTYNDLTYNIEMSDISYIHQQINMYLTSAVKKRLNADRPIGFLLSGGLDSSLITAIATKILGPDKIICFSVGLPNSSDVIAAKKVVEFLNIKHHYIVPFSIEDGIKQIPNVIKSIESYDVTTVRASTPQYIMAHYIKEKTDIRVLLSGEGSDEIHGSYRYFRNAPNIEEFHNETIRLLKDLYCFDNLRTDRTMSSAGLEVRVPFLDFEYVKFIKKINPKLLMYSEKYMEKQIIRDSFVGYLPNEILYRSKEAFSDAVSSKEVNWYKSIQSLAESTITQQELSTNPFQINKPETIEALYYRRIFDSYYSKRCNVIPYYWLPKFQSEKVVDPSATVLKCY